MPNWTMEFWNDLVAFLLRRKKFWLAPLILFLVFLGFIVVFGGGSAFAPLIYSLF